MTRAGRRPERRLGLALAGGGPEGAVYEIGALRALEACITGFDASRLDVYVGVSAGAFLSAYLANGVSTVQLARALLAHHHGDNPFSPAVFFMPAWREWTRRSLMLPGLTAEAVASVLRQPADLSALGALTRLARALPAGIFANEPIRRYVADAFAREGRSDDFRRLTRRLVIVAADLDGGRAIRFGEPGWDHVPISTAVQASCALPGLYPPVHIDGRDCVDGVLLRTVHASVALEDGADTLFCINPIVPADLSATPGAVLRGGLPTLLSQTFRTLIFSRLQVGMATYQRRFPNADVLLFQPAPDEHRMFFTNIFRFSSRRDVCELAFQSTRRDLVRRRAELAPALARAGLRFNVAALRDPALTVWQSVGLGDAPGARDDPDTPDMTRRLRRALERLEATLGAA